MMPTPSPALLAFAAKIIFDLAAANQQADWKPHCLEARSEVVAAELSDRRHASG
jgi:hypothetical protein